MRMLVCLLLLSSSLLAAPTAIIEGPATTLAGQLTILSAEKSTAHKVLWIVSKSLGDTLTCDNQRKLALATPTLGKHQVILVASDETGEMHYTIHTIEVVTSITPEKPEPPPPPPANYQAVEEASKQGANTLQDTTTTQSLVNTIRGNIATLKDSTLDVAKAKMVLAIEACLLQRAGASLSKDWLNLWRKPVNAVLQQYQFTTTSQYLEAMEASAKGLENSTFCLNCK